MRVRRAIGQFLPHAKECIPILLMGILLGMAKLYFSSVTSSASSVGSSDYMPTSSASTNAEPGKTETEVQVQSLPQPKPLASSWESLEEKGWHGSMVHVNGVKLSYYTNVNPKEGSRKPKLVFLHGIGMCGRGMISTFLPLGDEFAVYLPDARGHGHSEIFKNSFTSENLVLDVIGMIKIFGEGQAVILGGHGMGGSIAAMVSERKPNLVKALILEDPSWSWLPKEKTFGADQEVAPAVFESVKKYNATAKPPLLKEEERCIAEFQAHPVFATFFEAQAEYARAVNRINVPTLLQVGGSNMSHALCRPRVWKIIKSWRKVTLKEFLGYTRAIHFGTTQKEWMVDIRKFIETKT